MPCRVRSGSWRRGGGAAEDRGVEEAVGDVALRRPDQPLDAPGAALAAGVDEANKVFPGQVRPVSADQRHPLLRRLRQRLEVAVVAGAAQRADCLRVARVQPRIAADAAAGAGGALAGHGALADQGALQLGGGAEDLQGELALRTGGVDRVAERAEVGAAGLQPLGRSRSARASPLAGAR